MAIDGAGNAWITDTVANQVLKIAPDGTTVLGTYSVNSPTSLALDNAGDAWVVSGGDEIVKLSPSGVVLGSLMTSSVELQGIACDAAGDAWVADGNHYAVLKISPSVMQLASYPAGDNAPCGVAVDTNGNIWFTIPFDMTVNELAP